jgi:hypothetical protein
VKTFFGDANKEGAAPEMIAVPNAFLIKLLLDFALCLDIGIILINKQFFSLIKTFGSYDI